MNFKKFPADMQEKINASKIATWVNHGNNFEQCENCGGWGFFSLVVALAGPFNHPANSGSTTSDKINGNTVWYSTQTSTHVCPICKGNRYYKDAQPRQTAQPVKALADKFEF